MSTPDSSRLKSDPFELHLNQLTAQPTADQPDSHFSSTTDFIRKAVTGQPASETARLLLPKDAGMISAETLLAIVSYCYAKGIYSCREIEAAMLRDPGLRETLGPDLPSDACLRRFRRLNRTAIQTVLEKTFVQAKHELGNIPPDHEQSPALGQPAEATPTVNLPQGETTFLAREAAADRMQKALFIDGMTRDA